MSAIEQLPDGSAGNSVPSPPPLIFTAPTQPRQMADRRPLTQAASRRRTSWFRRFLAVVAFGIVVAGVVYGVRDSGIKLGQKTGAGHVVKPKTLLSANALNPGHHRHKHVKLTARRRAGKAAHHTS